MTNGPESADAPRRSRRAAGSTAAAGHQERESQQRARDREALRAYKALTDSEKRPEESSANPPTRRQLRIAQQQAQQAARQEAGKDQPGLNTPAPDKAPATNPAPAPAPSSAPAPPASGTGRRSGSAAPKLQSPPAEQASPAEQAQSGVPVEPAAQEGSRRQRRRRAAEEQQAPVIQPVTPAPSRAPLVKAPEAPAAAGHGKPAGPQDSKRPAEPQKPEPQKPEAQRSGARKPEPEKPAAVRAEPNADIADMSVEQALAAREALKHQARNQVAAMEALQKVDPHAVDLEMLAQQRALAERAAVLNRRTQNIQRLAQENEQRRSPQSDPTTAHNLAMVTPLEFVEVPGLERPVMKPPATSHVPVVTSSNPAASKAAVRPAPGAGRQAAVRQQGQAPRAGGTSGRATATSDVRHSKILARADALVNAPLDSDQGAKPIGARSAFGLDPLDVMTAGLGRTRRMRAVALGIVGVGLSALILGVILIVGGLGS